MGTINWLAVIAAAVSTFLIGGLWYSPALFARQWQAAAGLSDERLKGANMPLIFGLGFLFSLVMAANLAYFLSAPETTLQFALAASLAAGLGWVAMGVGILSLFERRPAAYLVINGGYFIVSFLVMGLILGLWR